MVSPARCYFSLCYAIDGFCSGFRTRPNRRSSLVNGRTCNINTSNVVRGARFVSAAHWHINVHQRSSRQTSAPSPKHAHLWYGPNLFLVLSAFCLASSSRLYSTSCSDFPFNSSLDLTAQKAGGRRTCITWRAGGGRGHRSVRISQ